MFNKRLISLIPHVRLLVAGSVACAVLAACAHAGALVNVARVLGQLGQASSTPQWQAPLCAALVAVCAFFVFTVLSRWFSGRAGAATKAGVSQMLFDKLVTLGAPFTLRARKSELAQLFGEGCESLAAYMARYVPQFFCAVLTPLVLAFVVGRFSVVAAVCMLVFVYCMPVFIMRFMKRAKKRLGERWTRYTDLGASFHDALGGLTTLKVYEADTAEHRELDAQAESFRETTMSLLRVQLSSVTFMDLFTYVGIAVGGGVAIVQASLGTLGFAECFAVVLLAPLVFEPMRSFGSLFHTGMNGEDVALALFEILDEEPVPAGTREATGADPEIRLDGLSFSYDGVRSALDDVTLVVPPNSIVGITGESGSGKTTLARVLAGVAAPYEGRASIGGIELADMVPASLAACVTYVSRQSHLFKGTVRSNMLMADPDVPDAFIWDALRRARIADEVLAAGGLDAPVAEGGMNFSGGQRQRLCFARDIIRDTPIYIFDEAASNVDAESEKLLYNVMHEIAFSKTVIVISHRLHMLTWVDRIFVLKEGRLVQQGDPGRLLSSEGTYRELWRQNAALEDFAEKIAAEDGYEPKAVELTPAQKVIAQLPGMAATAMQAVVDAKELQGYLDASSGRAPAGHPAWIPLPATYRDFEEDTLSDAGADNVQGSDGASESAQARGLIETMRGLAHMTQNMRADLCKALLAGFASRLAVRALVFFAVLAILSVVGIAPSVGLPVGIVGMLSCGLARGPLHYAERICTHDQTFKTLALVRSRVFEKMRTLAPAKLASRDAGDLVSLVTSDVELLEGFYSRTLTPVLSSLLCAFLICLAALFGSPVLGAILFACCALVGLVLPLALERTMRRQGVDVRSFSVAMYSFLLDSLEGFADLIQLGRARDYADEMRAHFGTRATGEGASNLKSAVLTSLPATCALLAIVSLCVTACLCVASNFMNVAWALLLCGVGISTLDMLVDVGLLFSGFSQTHAGAQRILDLIDEQPMVSDVEHGARLQGFEGASGHELGFAYGEKTVLEDISIKIPAGQVVRVVGESGAGKTTLLRLFMRFFDPQHGEVCISGTDVRNIQTQDLRRCESFMTQDTYLFAKTLRDNIKIGKLQASSEELDAAIAAAALEDTVARLPNGLDTMLGDGAAQLSDGERQRVGLARAFLHDAPFMILDEPTSNLDAMNEAAILYSIAANTRGKTVFVASHRPTMAAISDMTFEL